MTGDPIPEIKVDSLAVRFFPSRAALDKTAAADAANLIRLTADQKGETNLLLASGNSQLGFLAALRSEPYIPWPRVNIFHLDEYIGLDPRHPAGFSNFLRRELVSLVPVKKFYPVWDEKSDPETAARDYDRLLRAFPVDVCALGIGENGHLAFNDPPADFNDPHRIKRVDLAPTCRRQQVGEGHFARLEDVPTQALTLTIPALLSARNILAIVPEARKADAVYRAVSGPIHPDCPASILRTCGQAVLYLDGDSGARVRAQPE